MFRLLSIEFHKLRHSKASKVLILIYFGLLTSIALIAAVKIPVFGKTIHLAEQGIFNFPYIWHFNTYVAALLKFFLLLVIVSMMSNEYSNKTLKQNLIDGLSKKEFILSKFYTVIAFALISTLFVFIISLLLGLFYSDYNEFAIITSDLEYLFAFFIKLVGFFSFGLFLGILVKRSAFAIGAMVIWWIGEKIIWLIALWFFRASKEAMVAASEVTEWLPLQAMSNLIKEPGSRLGVVKTIASQMGGFTKSYAVELQDIATVSIWTFIFIYGAFALLKKRDL
jgi:ABC-type transport system involved in multi-copper enzyme maturation permease subunit